MVSTLQLEIVMLHSGTHIHEYPPLSNSSFHSTILEKEIVDPDQAASIFAYAIKNGAPAIVDVIAPFTVNIPPQRWPNWFLSLSF